MAETHSFDVHIAELYGINCAVLLHNLYYWIRKNEANETNYYDGTYWTYNSTKAFRELFPYLSQKQIETALKKLRDEGIIKTGNYNAVRYDRTLWYALTEKGKSILLGGEIENTKKVECILPTGEMEFTKTGNGFYPQGEPIPDINTDINTDVNKQKKVSKSSFDAIIANYAKGNEEITDLLGEWLKVRKAKRAAMTDRAIQMNIDKLDKLAAESNMSVTDYLKEVICKGWAAFYAITDYSKKPQQSSKPNRFNNFKQRQYDYEAMEQMLLKQQHPPKTAGEDESIRQRAEELQRRLMI